MNVSAHLLNYKSSILHIEPFFCVAVHNKKRIPYVHHTYQTSRHRISAHRRQRRDSDLYGQYPTSVRHDVIADPPKPHRGF